MLRKGSGNVQREGPSSRDVTAPPERVQSLIRTKSRNVCSSRSKLAALIVRGDARESACLHPRPKVGGRCETSAGAERGRGADAGAAGEGAANGGATGALEPADRPDGEWLSAPRAPANRAESRNASAACFLAVAMIWMVVIEHVAEDLGSGTRFPASRSARSA